MGGDWEGEGEGDGEDTRCTSMHCAFVDEDCVVTPTGALMGAGQSSKKVPTRPRGPVGCKALCYRREEAYVT